LAAKRAQAEQDSADLAAKHSKTEVEDMEKKLSFAKVSCLSWNACLNVVASSALFFWHTHLYPFLVIA
jgi:hypothetical protein